MRCRGPVNSLLMLRTRGISGPFFQNAGGVCVRGQGNAYALGGPLSGVRAYSGAVVDSTTIVVYFSQCVSFSGPLFTGIEYSIDGGAWTTVTGENKISDTQWEFTTGTIPINAEVRWRYVEGSGTLIDCVDAEDIGEQGPLNLIQGLQGYYLSANFAGPDQKLTSGQILAAADGVQVGELNVRRTDDVAGGTFRNEILGSQAIYGCYTDLSSARRQAFNTAIPATSRFGLTFLVDQTLRNDPVNPGIFVGDSNSTGTSTSNGLPSILYNNGVLRSINSAVGGYSLTTVQSQFLNSTDRLQYAIMLGGYNAAGKPYEPGDDPADYGNGASLFYKDGSGPWRLAYSTEIGDLSSVHFGLDLFANAGKDAVVHSVRIPIPLLTSAFATTAFLTAPIGGTAFAHKADTQIEFKLSAFSTAGNIEVRFRSDWAVLVGPTGDVTLIEDADGARTSRGSAASAATDTSRIVIKAYGPRIRVLVDTDSGNFEYEGATANQGATAGVVQSLGTGGGIAHLRSTPWGSEDEYSQLENYPGISEYPGASLEAQSVLTRMSAVNDTEIAAIQRFVDGCVDDGNWDKLDDFFCFALNSTDWLTGFKRSICTVGGGTVTHTAQGAEVTDGVSHLDTNLDPSKLHNYSLEDAEAGVLMYVVPVWGTGNFDLFGVEDSVSFRRLRMRHRGSDSNDMISWINSSVNTLVNSVIPDDLDSFVYSLRQEGAASYLLRDGVILPDAVGPTAASIPADGNIWLFRSQIGGVPQEPSRPSIMSVFYIGAGLDTAKLAARIKQLLFDILPESFVLIETGGEDIMLTEEDTDLTNGIKMEFSS